MKKILLFWFWAASSVAFAAGSAIYPWPTNWSLGGLASWSMPLVASGTALPAVGSAAEGDMFLVVDAASATWFRLKSSAWITAGGGASGVSTHSALTNLSFELASHTGFDSAASATLDAASLSAHLASATDPHTATMTVSSTLTVGSGTADCKIYRIGTETLGIASYVVIVPTAATPTAVIATGTLWYDSNLNVLRVWQGTLWFNLW